MKKLLIGALVITSALTAFANNDRISSVNLVDPVYTQTDVYYQDLLNRCYNHIQNLEARMRIANNFANKGQFNLAANQLTHGLQVEMASIPAFRVDVAYPYTTEAIRAANLMASTINTEASNIDPSGTMALVGKVRFNTIANAYSVIFKAYHQLDSVSYMQNINSCRRGCSFSSSNRYNDGARLLALDLLSYQARQNEAMAFDSLELATVKATVGSAKIVLAQSLFRRSYACSVTNLHNLELYISQAQAGSNGLRSDEEVDEIRGYLNSSIQQVTSNGCY